MATLVMERNLLDMDVRLLIARLDQFTGNNDKKDVSAGNSTKEDILAESNRSKEITLSA